MQKTMTVRSQKAGGPEPAGVARAAERDEVVAAGDEHRHEGRVLRHLLRVHAEPLRARALENAPPPGGNRKH